MMPPVFSLSFYSVFTHCFCLALYPFYISFKALIMKIGPYQLKSKLLLSPMVGITDRPYRDVCRQYGAGLTTSEMVTSDARLMKTRKTQLRLLQHNEAEPRTVQILGTDPQVMAQAALYNVSNGAQIIDINMGCPAKKVCNKAAGSALMQDPQLISKILYAVVDAVDVPVTLKTRTGWASNHRNVIEIAKIAEQAGIKSLAIHGRTREQAYTGYAEYETIRQVKHAISIPVIANGDIKNAASARFILDYTGVDGLMLGRITQGQPWIFHEINACLEGESSPTVISLEEKKNTVLDHICAIHRFYGTGQGVRIARKHIGWYLYNLTGHNKDLLKQFKKEIFSISSASDQVQMLRKILNDISSELLVKQNDHGTIISTQRIKAA